MAKETVIAPEASQRLTSADMVEVSPLVEGRQIPSEGTELFTTYNPASGEPLSRFGVGCAADVDKAVTSARRTYSSGVWRHTPPSAKKKTLLRWADLIERHAVRLAAQTPWFTPHQVRGACRIPECMMLNFATLTVVQ